MSLVVSYQSRPSFDKYYLVWRFSMKFLVFLTISLVVPGLLQGCSNSKAAAPAPESPDSDLTIDIDNDGTDGEVESCIICGSGKTNPCKRQVPCIKSINKYQK